MTAKHTPGPWRAEQRSDRVKIEPDVAIVYVQESQYDESQSKTRLANAVLIAAAPEMYQLIEKCYKVLHLGVWEVDETDEDVCSQINDIMCNHFGDNWRPRREQ